MDKKFTIVINLNSKITIKRILFRYTWNSKVKIKEKDASFKPNKRIPIEIKIKAH